MILPFIREEWLLLTSSTVYFFRSRLLNLQKQQETLWISGSLGPERSVIRIQLNSSIIIVSIAPWTIVSNATWPSEGT